MRTNDPSEWRFPIMPPISPAQWKAFSPRARWDVITALRGPDLDDEKSGAERLKWWTTCTIRGVMSSILPTSGATQTEPRVILYPSHPTIRPGTFNYNHFLGHVMDAGRVLNIPILHLQESQWRAVCQGEFTAIDALYSEPSRLRS